MSANTRCVLLAKIDIPLVRPAFNSFPGSDIYMGVSPPSVQTQLQRCHRACGVDEVRLSRHRPRAACVDWVCRPLSP